MQKLAISLMLLCLPAEAADHLFRVIQQPEAEEAFVTLDKSSLEKLLGKAEEGDRFVLPFPGGDAEFRVEFKVLDPAKELDCCFISLASSDGNGDARIRLTRSLDVRDFQARLGGNVYRFRATGNGNFTVRGPALAEGRHLPSMRAPASIR